MGNFILGLILLVVGVSIVIKTEAVLSFFGPIGFFERHLGAEGGSRLGWKLIGIIFSFIGFLVMTGLINGFMMWLLSPILQAGRPV